jgi:hypothetical protein
MVRPTLSAVLAPPASGDEGPCARVGWLTDVPLHAAVNSMEGCTAASYPYVAGSSCVASAVQPFVRRSERPKKAWAFRVSVVVQCQPETAFTAPDACIRQHALDEETIYSFPFSQKKSLSRFNLLPRVKTVVLATMQVTNSLSSKVTSVGGTLREPYGHSYPHCRCSSSPLSTSVSCMRIKRKCEKYVILKKTRDVLKRDKCALNNVNNIN